MTSTDIAQHPLLDRDQQKLARIFSRKAKADGDGDFSLLDFAKIALRATGRDFAEASDRDDEHGEVSREKVMADIALRRAAILYVYEALKAVDAPIIKQWDGFEEMLKSLTTLSMELP